MMIEFLVGLGVPLPIALGIVCGMVPLLVLGFMSVVRIAERGGNGASEREQEARQSEQAERRSREDRVSVTWRKGE